jgi:hypothetical protein
MFGMGIFLLVVAAMASVGFVMQRHRAGRLAKTPLVSTGDAASRGEAVAGEKGAISVQGKLSSPQHLVSPVTATPCLFSLTKVTADWKVGDSSSSAVICEDIQAARVMVDDGSGPVEVVLSNLDVGDYKQIFRKSNKMGLLNVLDGTTLKFGTNGYTVEAGTPDVDGRRVPQSAEYTVVEWVLPVLSDAYVSGKSEGGQILGPKWLSLIVSSKTRDELMAKTATMMKRTKLAAFVTSPLGAIATIIGLVLGSSPLLPKEDERVDLASVGVQATINVPKGGVVKREATGNIVRIEFGDLEHPAGELSVFGMRIHDLKCPASDKQCTVVQSKDRSVLYTSKSGRRTIHTAIVHLVFGDKSQGECKAESSVLVDAQRLLASCESLEGNGFSRAELLAPLAADAVEPTSDVAKAPTKPSTSSKKKR